MKNALIITSQLVQDHEFIYPFYRLKEEGINVDVYNQTGGIVKGFFVTKIPPQKDDNIVDISKINVDDYNILYELLEEEFEIKSNNINSDSDSDSDNDSIDN